MYNHTMKNNNWFVDLQSMMLARLHKMEQSPSVYWLCSDRAVRSKFSAMTNLSQGRATGFYFYDNEWAAADWTCPTSLTFDQLLVERALELRKKHQLVRLAYSGGSDSHTALMAFRMAGVAPDEIYYWTMLGEHSSKFDNNFEITRAVTPYVSTIQQWFPDTKIRHINLDYDRYRALKLLDPSHSAFELSNGLRSLTTSLSLAAFEDFEIGPGIVTVTGSDKPRIDFINGHWYAWITDVGCGHAWGQGVEGFFQSADPTLYIKQCHAMKNFINTNLNDLTRKNIMRFQNHSDLSVRKSLNAALGRHQPFDLAAMSSKKTKVPFRLGEFSIKSYCLWRTIRSLDQGPEFLQKWQNIKQQFNDSTGYCPTVEVFGKFYNLNTGEIHTVDQLFPNGWNLDD